MIGAGCFAQHFQTVSQGSSVLKPKHARKGPCVEISTNSRVISVLKHRKQKEISCLTEKEIHSCLGTFYNLITKLSICVFLLLRCVVIFLFID